MYINKYIHTYTHIDGQQFHQPSFRPTCYFISANSSSMEVKRSSLFDANLNKRLLL